MIDVKNKYTVLILVVFRCLDVQVSVGGAEVSDACVAQQRDAPDGPVHLEQVDEDKQAPGAETREMLSDTFLCDAALIKRIIEKEKEFLVEV